MNFESMYRALFVAALALASPGWAQGRSEKPKSLRIGPPQEYTATKLAWSPDSRFLATALGTWIQVWNARSGTLARTLKNRENLFVGVQSLTFSPDGETLAADHNTVGNSDGTRLWKWRSGKALRPPGVSFGPLAWVSNHQMLSADVNDLHFRKWDVSNGKLQQQIRVTLPRDRRPEMPKASSGASGITPNLVFSSNARQGAVILWTSNFERTADGYRQIPPRPAETLFFDPLTGRHQRLIAAQPDEFFFPQTFSRNGRVLALFDPGWGNRSGITARVRLLAFPSGREMTTFQISVDEDQWRDSVALSPQGGTVAVAASRNIIQLHDTATGQMKRQFKGHRQGITALAFSPDGATLASASLDGTVKLWPVK